MSEASARRGSRGLLLSGPQPPLSHFGATLLRHVVVTSLRYSFYHLGLPLPVKAPTRIERLRLELDSGFLAHLLDSSPGGATIARALADPGGTDEGLARPAGAMFFHRMRLRFSPSRALPVSPDTVPDSVAALESAFREQLSACMPQLNDAMLSEILGAAARRRRRAQGQQVDACRSPEAAAFLVDGNARCERLGALDPFTPSWAEEPPDIDVNLVPPGGPPRDRRGRFREIYREILDRLRPTLLALGARACRVGIASHRDDLFFLPMELIGDLTLPARPPWLDAAVLRNRGEYFEIERDADAEIAARWRAAPLHPLP